MVQILKQYIHAEKAGRWAVTHMPPFMVSAKHTRYMYAVLLHLKDMRDLERSPRSTLRVQDWKLYCSPH
jgi:hypothetical protein